MSAEMIAAAAAEAAKVLLQIYLEKARLAGMTEEQIKEEFEAERIRFFERDVGDIPDL
jgi:Xaa-Pro aminopeptidase